MYIIIRYVFLFLFWGGGGRRGVGVRAVFRDFVVFRV